MGDQAQRMRGGAAMRGRRRGVGMVALLVLVASLVARATGISDDGGDDLTSLSHVAQVPQLPAAQVVREHRHSSSPLDAAAVLQSEKAEASMRDDDKRPSAAEEDLAMQAEADDERYARRQLGEEGMVNAKPAAKKPAAKKPAAKKAAAKKKK